MSEGVATTSASRPTTRDLLERVAVLQRRAAAILRGNGMRSEAARAEQFGVRARLMLDQARATRRMQALARGLSESSQTGSLLERALEGAMSLIGGDFGNVQIRDPVGGGLRIAAQCGLSDEFLEYFAVVEDDSSACGRAATQRSQTVIVDVNEDAAFATHRAIAAASGFRAVQSTPLVDPSGCLRGVISTHYRRPHRPSGTDLQLVQWFAEHVGAALAESRPSPTTLYEATAALHAQTAYLHDTAAACLNGSARALPPDADGARALERRERARRAIERARQERARAQVLRARADNANGRYPGGPQGRARSA